MNKPNLTSLMKSIRTVVKKHSPEILTGIGIAGMITTTVMAVRATPKALILIEDKKKEDGVNKLTPIDTVKAAWPCYIPAAMTGCLSIACLIGASSANMRRNAALATAYTLSETALKEYQGKVIETIGEKKEQVVREAIVKDKLEKDPVTSHEVVITDKGNTLCYDVHAGRYFESDIDKIKKAVNDTNENLLKDMYVSLNDFYYELGLESTKMGEDLGWNIEQGQISVNFSSHLASNGRPCLAMDYKVAPRYDYYK